MIRPYEKDDLEQLLDTWAEATAVAHPFLSNEFLASERENIVNLYLPNTETWVDHRQGRVVGFVSLLGNEVGALFVHPDHHRQGVGRGLMNKAHELRGELDVEVFEENPIGRAFYANYGFRPIAEKLHEPSGHNLLRLRFTVEQAPGTSK